MGATGLAPTAIVVLAAAEVAHDAGGAARGIDGDDGVHAGRLAGAAQIVDRLAGPMRPGLARA